MKFKTHYVPIYDRYILSTQSVVTICYTNRQLVRHLTVKTTKQLTYRLQTSKLTLTPSLA